MKKCIILILMILAAYLSGRNAGEHDVLKYQFIHTDGKGKIVSNYAGVSYIYDSRP